MKGAHKEQPVMIASKFRDFTFQFPMQTSCNSEFIELPVNIMEENCAPHRSRRLLQSDGRARTTFLALDARHTGARSMYVLIMQWFADKSA
jgi:hypothetical protein